MVAVISPLPIFSPLFSFPISSHVTKKRRGKRRGRAGGEAIESNRFENLIGGKHGKSITNFSIAILSRRTSNINTFSFRYLYQWGTQRVYEYAPIFHGIRGTLRQRRKIRHLVSDSIHNPPSPTRFSITRHDCLYVCVCVEGELLSGNSWSQIHLEVGTPFILMTLIIATRIDTSNSCPLS